ncbi:hypothetical protein ACLB2K_059693 [Fragaria x ananassa]
MSVIKVKGKEVLELGTRWRVGNGRSINVKNDRWIPQPLIFKVVTPNEELWNMQVTEFIEPGVGAGIVLFSGVVSLALAQWWNSWEGCCLVNKIVNWWELNERAGKGEDEGWEVLRQEAAVIDRRETTWKKPSPGVVKLNIDVAVDAKGKFRTGAIVRDENGDAQSVFAALDSLDDFSDNGALVDEVKVLISGYESCSWGFVPRFEDIDDCTIENYEFYEDVEIEHESTATSKANACPPPPSRAKAKEKDTVAGPIDV